LSETLEVRNRPLRRLAAGLNSDGALYFALLLLVGGLTVPMRGLWQDDTLLLRLARNFQGHGFMAALTPVVAPLRRLYTLPFRLALATPQPIWTLHVVFGLTWLGQALAAGWIVRLLLPGRQLTRFLAICLTLTATSDYLTDNPSSWRNPKPGAGSPPPASPTSAPATFSSSPGAEPSGAGSKRGSPGFPSAASM
jgi:hypothetical protein